MALNPKQQRFRDEYLKDLNATQAAIRAGYSPKTASSQGERLLRNAEIANSISVAKRERSERTRIDADWLLNRLAEEAEADIADLYDESGAMKPVHQWPKIWRQGLIAGLDVDQQFTMTDGERVPDGVIVKVKLSDRAKRLEMIGKHIGVQAFKEKIEHSVDDDIAKLLAEGRRRVSSDT